MRGRDEPRAEPASFGAIACVTDGSPAAAEAVRQAACLVDPRGELALIATAPDPGPGRLHPHAAQIEALVEGTEIASRRRVPTAVHIAVGDDEVKAVLRSCRDRGLLVVPAGTLARALLPRAGLPVLVARPVADGPGFPAGVLVAVDGSAEAHEAARLGARLATRDPESLALVASPEHDHRHQSALQRDAATAERTTGRRPLILDEHGPPAASIAAAAASTGASLIVIGRRAGRHAASVSAEVAERAPCSVLVLRPGAAS